MILPKLLPESLELIYVHSMVYELPEVSKLLPAQVFNHVLLNMPAA
uniref:Uncharacterized protein n=1 Tax=Arundo donax TaxID=35708 RepID=A0A0A9GYB2_ARUDO